MTVFPLKNIIKGIVSFIPYSAYLYKKIKPQTSHSGSNARFCYSMWLRIIVILNKKGIENNINSIAEIGNSSSFGIGLMALITGVKSYSSLELEKFEMTKKNLILFEELVALFFKRQDIPNESEFPQINIKLESYEFPYYIFPDSKLSFLLSESRLIKIKNSIYNTSKAYPNNKIRYYVPWEDNTELNENSFDLIFSRATMEHVSEVKKTYYKLGTLLKQQGIMIHDIDYHNHRIGKEWNSHWFISSFIWFLIKGKNIGIINRLTHGMHYEVLTQLGYDIIEDERTLKPSKLTSSYLPRSFKDISRIDLCTYGGYFIAKISNANLVNLSV